MRSNQRRDHEIYYIFKLMRHTRSHTSPWCLQWIRRNYFVSDKTIYNALSDPYGEYQRPIDPNQASAAYHIAISDEYQKHA